MRLLQDDGAAVKTARVAIAVVTDKFGKAQLDADEAQLLYEPEDSGPLTHQPIKLPPRPSYEQHTCYGVVLSDGFQYCFAQTETLPVTLADAPNLKVAGRELLATFHKIRKNAPTVRHYQVIDRAPSKPSLETRLYKAALHLEHEHLDHVIYAAYYNLTMGLWTQILNTDDQDVFIVSLSNDVELHVPGASAHIWLRVGDYVILPANAYHMVTPKTAKTLTFLARKTTVVAPPPSWSRWREFDFLMATE